MADVKKIFELAKQPLADDKKIKRVEIIVLKFKEEPEVIDECITRIIHTTQWPFKLNIFDNRPNSANTSKIWNKLIKESTCDYVCMIDSDAFVPAVKPCWLTRLMESVDQHGIVVPMGEGAKIGGANKDDHAWLYPSEMLSDGIWSGFCFLLRKDLMDKVGWFDEDFYLYGQDSYFAYKLRKKFGGTIFRTDVLVRHLAGYSADKAEKEDGFDNEAEKQYARSLFALKCQGKL
jgi:GT2 family glycosyltransferase